MTQTEAIADEKSNLSREFQSKIADNLITLKNKCERVANLANSINDYLVEEKNKFEDEVNKTKSIMIHYVKLQKLLETK